MRVSMICIKRGKRSGIGTSLKVMYLTVLEIKEGDHYKYLGIDESVGYYGPLNKERVTKSIEGESIRSGDQS